MMRYLAAMEGDLTDERPAGLAGLPASGGSYVGVVRVVEGLDEMARVRPGEVLVARSTLPSCNGALAIAGAVVTERGGALSHAAIVARELGIPAVVGVRDATRALRTGARVRVDGTAGTVERLP
ncbi:MAG: hypothetical protein H6706_07550 [Myxococcales bacterium]|nr:hypothetical protein [Myxococcales bacterium]